MDKNCVFTTLCIKITQYKSAEVACGSHVRDHERQKTTRQPQYTLLSLGFSVSSKMDPRRLSRTKPKPKIPPLDKKIKPNPKYENVRPTIDTGNNTRKQVERYVSDDWGKNSMKNTKVNITEKNVSSQLKINCT